MSARLSKDEVLYVQRICSCCGFYTGRIDGKWSDEVDQAETRRAERCAELQRTLGTFDPRSEQQISSLMPPAQEVARHFMKAAADFPLKVKIISGSRSYPEQDALFAIGRTTQRNRKPVTNAKGGQSNHNFGIAWDVGIFAADGRYLDGSKPGDNARYAELGKLMKKRVEKLEWGGDWTSFVDPPHYQLATGKTTRQVRQEFEAGRSLAG